MTSRSLFFALGVDIVDAPTVCTIVCVVDATDVAALVVDVIYPKS